MNDARPDADALLSRLQSQERARGKLKIFFGAAPGVGKTYAMLEAGRKLAKAGVDVVVGYVEPHARPETQALVLGLDVLPRRFVDYRGRQLAEFDLEAALDRRPKLLLVDELAHTNASGLTHAKRWQDVEQLRDAGIDVFTTLNVQHLETQSDAVARVTGAAVRETVPDSVFEKADEVELVDLAPDSLIERLQEGKVYLPDQARAAMANFFRPGNLIALRELALRKMAERVGEETLSFRRRHDVAKIWPTSERLLVCVGSSPLSARLVRAARRMAAGSHAPWTALYVAHDRAPPLADVDRRRLERNLQLAEELGAEVAATSGADFAGAVIEFAREHNVTKIVIGKPQTSRWRELIRGAYVHQLIRRCRDIDIYVISGDDEGAPSPRLPESRPAMSPWPYVWAAIAVALATLANWGLFQFLDATNLVMIYLSVVVAVALAWGRGPSIVAAVLSVATFDVFFVPPYGTLAVSDTQYLFTFGVMLVTGLVISELTARVRASASAVRARERRTAALYRLSRELTGMASVGEIAGAAQTALAVAMDAHVWLIVPEGSRLVAATVGEALPAKDEGVIRWVFDHNESGGRGTQTLPGSEGLYLPLSTPSGVVGVLGIRLRASDRELSVEQTPLLETFASQLATAIERFDLARQADEARLRIETERMRNLLLSAISHDLRTPLATIVGAASALAEGDDALPESSRRELAGSIVDEADRLHRLVVNLLDFSRLEARAVSLQMEWQPIEETIGAALGRLERRLRGRAVATRIDDDLPPVRIDGLLIEQVLINLLDNAARFSPPNSAIEVSAERRGDRLIVRVADRGPGIRDIDRERIFEKFYRAAGQTAPGSGLGLAICREIVDLHKGTIQAANREGGGMALEFSLPLETSARLDA